MSSIVKSSILVTIFTGFSLFLAFLSNAFIAAKFGAGSEMDIYFAAATVPLFFVSILTSALNFTFIPVFAEYRVKDINEIWRVVSSFINLNLVFSLILCLIGIVFAFPIVKFITPGFDAEKARHSALLLRIMLPIILFTVVNELMASVYYSNQRFLIPSFNKVISPAITIAFVSIFHVFLSTKSIAIAMLASSFIQMILLSVGFIRSKDFKYIFCFDYSHPGVTKLLKLMIPLILGMLIYRAIPMFDRYFLSQLQVGSISYVEYAKKLLSVFPPLISAGISVSIFPMMSKYAAAKEWNKLRELMSKGIRVQLFVSIPIAILLWFDGQSVVKLIFERGAFTTADTLRLVPVFLIYLFQLPASIIGGIVSQGFYVLQNTKTLAILGALEGTLYFICCYLLVPHLGYLAIPTASVVYFNSAVILNGFVFRYCLGIRGGKMLLKSFLIQILISIFVVTFLYIANKLIQPTYITLCGEMGIAMIFFLVVHRVVFKTDESKFFIDNIYAGLIKKYKMLNQVKKVA